MSSVLSDSQALLEQAAAWKAAGQKVAVATVVKTWGSSPRPPGSLLIVREDGAFVGSVSGGCIEAAVVTAAQASMQDRAPRLLSFGVTNDMAWEVGLACGGQVEVFVRALAGEGPDVERYAALRRALTQRQPVALLTAIPDGDQQLLTLDASAVAATLRLPADEAVRQTVASALTRDQALDVASEDATAPRRFVQPFCPPPRLIIVGAVHIAQPLSQLAALTGLEVLVIDPRTAFASEARFPGVDLRTSWPAQALASVGIDGHTAVVTLTHDPKLDDPALEVALRSPAFYVGALGSGKTHASRCNRLRAKGFSDEQIARVHGPVGLKIGARSPAEIAVSILAELIAALRGEAR